MQLYAFLPSTRVLAIMAVKAHLQIDCIIRPIDLSIGDHNTPEYVLLNPNRKVPVLEDDGFVLWESNAILFHFANKSPQSGLWPEAMNAQSDVLRWLAWECAHWDAESIGMIAFERASKGVLGLGAPDETFIARGEQNFRRFAAVLDHSLNGNAWLVDRQLTIADFSIAAFIPTAERLGLPMKQFPNICRWYEALASLPAWIEALKIRDDALQSWLAHRGEASKSDQAQ